MKVAQLLVVLAALIWLFYIFLPKSYLKPSDLIEDTRKREIEAVKAAMDKSSGALWLYQK